MKKISLFIIFILGLLVTINGALATIPTSNLLYGYNFEQASASNLNDVKGIINLSVSGTPTNVSGKIGSGKLFSGTGTDYYSVASYSSKLNNAYGVTMCTWFNKTGLSAWGMVWQDEINPNSNGYYVAVDESTNKYFFNKHDGSGGNSFTSTGTSPAGVWTHVCMVDTGTQFKLYVNGNNTENASATRTISEATRKLFVGKRSDGFGIGGMLDEMYVWNGSLTSAEIQEVYQAGNTGLSYPWVVISALVNISFLSQIPSDITSTSLFSQKVNITYYANQTNVNQTIINISLIGDRTCISFLNGSCVILNNTYYMRKDYNKTNNSVSIYFEIPENDIYPSNNYYNESSYEYNLHTDNTLSNQNWLLKHKVINMTTNTYYNFFEAMVNVTGGLSSVYYCNSSYNTGAVTTSNFCGVISQFNYTNYNHTHGNSSKHNLFQFLINSTGHVNNLGVKATGTSYFIFKGNNVADTHYFTYLGNVDNATMFSINNGVSYTVTSGLLDAHLHQYNPNYQFKYVAGLNRSGVIEWENVTHTDNLDLSFFNPTTPNIITPVSQAYTQFINITYQASQNLTGTISYYNISLLNNDNSLNQTLIKNNLSLYYYWNTYLSNLTIGTQYRIKVLVFDSNNLTSESISENFTTITNGNINISAYLQGTTTLVNNYSINQTNIDTGDKYNFSTTTGKMLIPIIKGNNYSYIFEAIGYAYRYINITFNNTYNHYNFSVFDENSFSIRFFDELTNTIISGQTIDLEYISDVQAGNKSTTTGSMYINLLNPVTYTLRYDSLPDYPTRIYFIQLINRSHYDIDLYLVNTTSVITINVKDQDDNVIGDAYIKVLRYTIQNNTYTLREIAKTNQEGNAYFSGTIGNEYYKFIIEYPLGTEVLTTTPDYLRSSSLTLRVNLRSDTLSDYFNALDVYSTLNFNTLTNNFNYYYNDATNTADEGCLYVYRTINQLVTETNKSCSSTSSATILLGVENKSGYTYIAQGTIKINGQEYVLKEESYTYPSFQNTNAKNDFTFLTIILTGVLALIFLWNVSIAFLIVPLPIFFMSLTGLIQISRPVAITLMLIGVTLSFLISRKA